MIGEIKQELAKEHLKDFIEKMKELGITKEEILSLISESVN